MINNLQNKTYNRITNKSLKETLYDRNDKDKLLISFFNELFFNENKLLENYNNKYSSLEYTFDTLYTYRLININYFIIPFHLFISILENNQESIDSKNRNKSSFQFINRNTILQNDNNALNEIKNRYSIKNNNIEHIFSKELIYVYISLEECDNTNYINSTNNKKNEYNYYMKLEFIILLNQYKISNESSENNVFDKTFPYYRFRNNNLRYNHEELIDKLEYLSYRDDMGELFDECFQIENYLYGLYNEEERNSYFINKNNNELLSSDCIQYEESLEDNSDNDNSNYNNNELEEYNFIINNHIDDMKSINTFKIKKSLDILKRELISQLKCY